MTSLKEIENYYALCEDTSRKVEYERLLKKLSNTTTSREFFRKDARRKKLHSNILQQKLEKYKSKHNPVIHFVLGSIGSGKTSIKDKFFDVYSDFIYINFDELKKSLPEYEYLKEINPRKAAQFVQSESSVLAGNLLRKAMHNKYHIVFEKNIVKNSKGEFQLVQDIKSGIKKGYTVSLNIIFLDSLDEAWKRVKKRTEEIRRYVSKAKVRDTFETLFNYLNEVYRCISNENFTVEKSEKTRFFLKC